jgi:hypothetical protein
LHNATPGRRIRGRAPNQHRDHRAISQLARARGRRRLKKPPALLRRQPVPQAHADPSHSLHPSDTGHELTTQEAGVGRLVCDPPDRGEPKIDRGRRIFALFEVNPVSVHDGAVEREANSTGDELANRVVVGSLTAN